MLMIMILTGRPFCSAYDGPAKSPATRTPAPASRYPMIDRTVSNGLRLCMEAPPFGVSISVWECLRTSGVLSNGRTTPESYSRDVMVVMRTYLALYLITD